MDDETGSRQQKTKLQAISGALGFESLLRHQHFREISRDRHLGNELGV